MSWKKRLWLMLVFLTIFNSNAYGVKKFFFLVGSGCWGITAYQAKRYFEEDSVVKATRLAYENILINGSGTDLPVRLLEKRLAHTEAKRSQDKRLYIGLGAFGIGFLSYYIAFDDQKFRVSSGTTIHITNNSILLNHEFGR